MTTIAVIGGTGPQGRGLGYRFARGGYDVALGSRSEERALDAVAGLNERICGPGSSLGATNVKAVETAELVVLAVPFAGHQELVSDLAPVLTGKVVIICVNPSGSTRGNPTGWPCTTHRLPSRLRSCCGRRRWWAPSTTFRLCRCSVRRRSSTTRTS
jgi:predicted dinucleotide-binding enzyme